jgi:hypothetical protein
MQKHHSRGVGPRGMLLPVGGQLQMRFPPDIKWYHGKIIEYDAEDKSYRIHFAEDNETLWFTLDVELGNAREVLQGGLGSCQPFRLLDPPPMAASSSAAPAQKRPSAAAKADVEAEAAAKGREKAAKRPHKQKPPDEQRRAPAGKRRLGDLELAEAEEDEAQDHDVEEIPAHLAAGRMMRARKVIDYRAAEHRYDDESMGASSDEEDEVPGMCGTKTGQNRARSRHQKGRAARKQAASEDDESGSGDDDDDDDDDGEDGHLFMEGGDDGEGRSRRRRATVKAKASASSKDGDARSMTKEDRAAELLELQAIWAAPPARRLKEPAERPGYSEQREKKAHRGQRDFLDTPFDITDRGVVHIVKEQARRLKPLLEHALQRKTIKAGGLPPVHLQVSDAYE